MIIIEARDLNTMARAAEVDYPRECCGLLVGLWEKNVWKVKYIVPSKNVAPSDRCDRFEIDPGMRLKLQRKLREGPDDVIGHYHSHPDGTATPSSIDKANIWEQDMLWVIISVVQGHTLKIAAHRVIKRLGEPIFTPAEICKINTLDPVEHSR